MTYGSAGYYALEINVRNGDKPVPHSEINHRELAQQLREFAEMIEEENR